MSSKGISIVGEKATQFYGLLALRSAVSLELKGLKLSRGRSASAIAKQKFDLPKGWRKERVHEWLEKHIEEVKSSPDFQREIGNNITTY